MILASATILGAQILTFAFPLGMLAVVCFWAYFQRRPSR